jgi:glucan 1,4-alpha-glucosidase
MKSKTLFFYLCPCKSKKEQGRMRKFSNLIIITILIFGSMSCCHIDNTKTLLSPSGNNSILFFLDDKGVPNYLIKHKNILVIDTSALGFDFKGQLPLSEGLEIIGIENSSFDEDWEMPWGEQRLVNNNYNQLLVRLKEQKPPGREINIYFRAFDDAVAFRYEFPKQQGIDSLIIQDENTQFNLTEDPTCWWIPGDWDIYEHLYNTTKFSEIDAIEKSKHVDLAQSYIPENAVNTPFTMRMNNGLHLSFHEANLTDYAGMTLKIDTVNLSMSSGLVGSDRLGYKVKCALPFSTPWRTIQISENAKDLISSKIILNLNEPNCLGDVSWFKPKKYVGIWWEMLIGESMWDMASGRHGATTENAKKYIDFAAANNITGVLVEGWNTGWEHWIGFEDREGVFDFVTPYSDYDLIEVVRYANEKGVEMIMHHETSGAPRTYDQQMDTAFALMQELGINAVKTGYVGTIIPKGEYHHGQWMVNHYRRVLEKAAEAKIAINAHEPIKATGIRRTYPNAISREGLRGQEFNAWSSDGGNPPEHLSIVAFTRMLAGPIDFTPGVFDIKLPSKENNQINTTLAHQLALYVVVYSPIQMACDLPENYVGNPAFQFIRDVGVDWEQTIVLDGEVGDFVTIARQEKESGDWFVGSITDENKREITVDFDFLEPGLEYEASIYKDGLDAHWDDKPLSLDIEKALITKETERIFILAEGGGLAISLKIKK